MTHQTFKVSIIIEDLIENFYIKSYVDDFQPIFGKFKNLVFQRNPLVDSPQLKVYWIDAENDKILISCEEDFRLYIEQGQGKKVFFNVTSKKAQTEDKEEDDPMEAEDSRQKLDRKSRKSARDEEKQRRASKRLIEKMRHAEEKAKAEEDRCSRFPEKHERKNAERLEKARRKCEQIRQLLYGSTDPANLNDASPTSQTASSATTTAQSSIDQSLAVMHPTAETIRMLSSAIAGCLQPCNLINKILTDIIGMVPVPNVPTTAGENVAPAPAQRSADYQQQTEFPRQNIATNTSSFLNTPIPNAHPSNQEIEALFKEAAKELEKMNEIANSSKSMESSRLSLGSSNSAITQVEQIPKNFTESSTSDSTVVNVQVSQHTVQADKVDSRSRSPDIEDDFKILSPPKSMRSRESSIEVHDVNSMMSDDSRDWTMLDAVSNEQDEDNTSALLIPPTSLNTTFASAVGADNNISVNSVANETRAPSALLIQSESMTPSEVSSSIQKSIEAVGQLNQMVKDSVELAQQSLDTIQKPISMPVIAPQPPVLRLRNETVVAPTAPVVQQPEPSQSEWKPSPSTNSDFTPSAPRYPQLGTLSALTQANLTANRLTGTKPKTPQMGPAVVVYDPNPKINTAVHTMLAMGFTNEGGWLTQLLLNVDGDVPKAIAFLTPQPKNQKP